MWDAVLMANKFRKEVFRKEAFNDVFVDVYNISHPDFKWRIASYSEGREFIEEAGIQEHTNSPRLCRQ